MIRRMFKSEWQIAFRERKKKLLFEEGGLNDEFTVMPNPWRYWCADPFLIDFEGHEFLFMECYDRLKRKGVIGFRELFGDGKYGKLKIVYETAGHLSYPFVFKKDKNVFMIPESSQERKVRVVKAVRFPDTWVEVGTIFDNECFADTTLYFDERNVWLFSTPIREDNASKLELFRYVDGKFENEFQNPVVDDKSSARQAGKIIVNNGEKWRVSQDCQEEYGKALNYNRIIRLSPTQYEETLICKITPDLLKTNAKKKFDGVHTYNFDEKYEVIDLKRNKVFKFANLFGWALSKIKGLIR